MASFFSFWIKLVKYFYGFGFQGLRLLWKRFIHKNKIFTISHPRYKFPFYLRNGSSDSPIFSEIIMGKEYYLPFDFTPKIIIDCGANIGLSAVYFKNRYPEAKIISIEPDQDNFESLVRNTINYQDIERIFAGIWNESCNLVIKPGIGNMNFMAEKAESGYVGQTVPAVSIQDIMKKYNLDHIDILKIDIEGSEKELFEKNCHEWLSKTRVVIIELHDSLRKGASMAFFKALCQYDFDMYQKGENIYCFLHQPSEPK